MEITIAVQYNSAAAYYNAWSDLIASSAPVAFLSHPVRWLNGWSENIEPRILKGSTNNSGNGLVKSANGYTLPDKGRSFDELWALGILCSLQRPGLYREAE
jgi:hypothetical protein